MEEMLNRFTNMMGADIWNVGKALGILIIGWIVAHILAAIVRGALRKTSVDNKIAAWFAGDERLENIDLEAAIAKVVYYVAMLFVLVAVFEALELSVVTEPLRALLGQVMEYAPRLFSAAVLIGVAWLIATGVKLVVTKGLAASKLEKRVLEEAGEDGENSKSIGETIGEALYWFIFLIFLPGILGTLALDGMMQPVQSMMNEAIGFLPNLFTAGMTLAVGWLVARIVQRIVTNFTAAAGLDSLGEKFGLEAALGGQKLSKILGIVVYVFIFIPILISALSALHLDAVTEPLSNMLNMILGAIPAVFAATLVLAVSYLIGRIVAGLVSNMLANVGFNTLLAKIGLGDAGNDESRSPSAIVGSIVLAFVMLFAATEAAGLLGFESLETLVSEILVVAGRVVFGVVLFGVGLFIGNFVAGIIRSSGAPNASVLSTLARVAILVLTGAVALRQMGIANEIIQSAFSLTLGAFAVAAAIAFGIGGRDIAARQLEQWTNALQGGPVSKPE